MSSVRLSMRISTGRWKEALSIFREYQELAAWRFVYHGERSVSWYWWPAGKGGCWLTDVWHCHGSSLVWFPQCIEVLMSLEQISWQLIYVYIYDIWISISLSIYNIHIYIYTYVEDCRRALAIAIWSMNMYAWCVGVYINRCCVFMCINVWYSRYGLDILCIQSCNHIYDGISFSMQRFNGQPTMQ